MKGKTTMITLLWRSVSLATLTLSATILPVPVLGREPLNIEVATPILPQQLALTPTDVNTIASEITVRIDGPRGGSGVIIEKQGNTYYILTNWHVVNRVGDYEVITPDGERHSVYYSLIRELPGLDLAILPFTTSQSYQVATVANSDTIPDNSTVYVAGWPRSNSTLGNRLFLSTKGTITHRQEPRKGYTLVYTNLVRSGMSGGPVLNEEGNVIAINGIVQFGLNRDTIVAAGIEINRFLDWRKTATLPNVPERLERKPTVTNPQPQNHLPPAINPATNVGSSDSNFTLATSLTERSGEILALDLLSSEIFSSNSNGTVSVWSLETGEQKNTWKAHQGSVNALAVSSIGQVLATASDDGTVKLWSLSSSSESQSFPLLQTLKGHSNAVLSVEFSPDNRILASGSWDNTVKIWDTQTGELLRTLSGHSQLVSTLAISPNSEILASGSKDSSIKIWNLQTGELIRTLSGHSLPVLSVDISPNGQILASGSADGTIVLWNLQTGEPIRRLNGHTDGVWSVVISPDGQTLVSGSWDKTVKLWDVATGELKGNLTGHSGYVNAVEMSQDGKIIVSGGWDSQVKIWRWNQ